MFSTIRCAFQLLPVWLKSPKQQAALLRKIVDRIRNSLELQVVLQTAVDELATLLGLDCCSFFWYFKDTQRIQVVCEQNDPSEKDSHLGYYPLESLGAFASTLPTGKLIRESGVTSNLLGWSRIFNRVTRWLQLGEFQPLNLRESPEQPPCTTPGNRQLFGYSASLLIPVMGKDDGIGFIACFSKQPRSWLAAEVEFLESIAEPLEIAIRQAQLYEQTQKQAIREQLVNQITSQTRQSFDLEKILTEAIAQLRLALQADRCLVHLVEDANPPEAASPKRGEEAFRRKHLYEVYGEPFSASIDDFDTHGPITEWVIQHRQRVMIPDIEQDERIGRTNAEYQKAQIQSSLVLPVQANGKLYALLYLNQCSYKRYWSQNDQKLVQAVADQLAISLQQAYLYARTQEQAAYNAIQAEKMAEMLNELRLTQAQLIHSEKMSSLGRLVAGVAHEINNPVNFIYGNIPYVEYYVNDLIRLVEAYQAEHSHPSTQIQQLSEQIEIDFLLRDLPKILKSMRVGTERIHEIVQLLQKFSGSNVASLKLIDLNAALESTLLILHNQITGTIQVERHYDDLPPVECYPKQINQAFLNILTNAIEALNRSDELNKIITLRTQWVPSCEAGKEDRVQIVIQDNGAGIRADIQPRIFEPFFTTKEVGQGKGLGLTVSYQAIVNQHQGQLEVKSQLGQGTEFLLEIPVRVPQPLPSESSLHLKQASPIFSNSCGKP